MGQVASEKDLRGDKDIFEDGVPMPDRIWTVISTMFAIFMACVLGSMVNVALPTLAKEFEVSSSTVIWVVNALQLTSIICLLPLSFIADLKGFRKIYLAGIAIIVVMSLLCALSVSFTMLVVCSALQGFGAACVVGVNIGQLRVIYPKRILAAGIGLNSMVVAFSSVAGPSIAGAILSMATWRWLFVVNIPFGIVALILGTRFLPRSEPKLHAKFDYKGALLNALMFFLLIYALMGFAHGMRYYFAVAMLIAAVIVGTIYFKSEAHTATPVFPVDLIKIPLFRRSVFTSSCSFTAEMLAMVSLPFFLQGVAGKTAATTGLLITPWPIAVLITAPIAGLLISKIHPGFLGCIGMSIFAVGVFLLSTLSPSSSETAIIVSIAVCGAGFGLFQTPNNDTILVSSPANRGGAASGMIGTARLVGQCFGAALVALFLDVIGDDLLGLRVCFYLSIGFAICAASFSISRVKYALPKKTRISDD